MDLKNKRIVVIGGTSGIGLATARLAIQRGASLLITGFRTTDLGKIKTELGGDIEAFSLDISDEGAVKDFFEKIGDFDYLTTPGSVFPSGPFLSMDSKTARAGFDSKFWGQYFAAKYAAPHIKLNGAIVFFAGASSQKPALNSAISTSINSAIEGLARALALEIAPIRVNVISPGLVETERFKRISENDQKNMIARYVDKTPLKRLGQPEELAEVVLFLMANTFMTGQTCFVDGGYLLS